MCLLSRKCVNEPGVRSQMLNREYKYARVTGEQAKKRYIRR